MIWARYIGISALALLAACSNDAKDVAGSSLETENSIAFKVTNSSGFVAANVQVIINTSDYLASGSSTTKKEELFTDSEGILVLDSLHKLTEGEYLVEVRSTGKSAEKGAVLFEVPKEIPDSGMTVPVKTALPHKFSGIVQTDKSPVWVKIRGLDYLVQVDKQGAFTFESLPEGEFEFVLVSPATDGKPQTILGKATLCVGCKGNTSSSILVDTTVVKEKVDPPKEPVKKDTTKTDSVKTDPVPKDTLKHFMFDDFENDLDDEGHVLNWYSSHSDDATAELEIINTDSDREGYVAHFSCTNDVDYNWALMGQYLGGAIDMSKLDSIVFWARGTIENYISFSFDIIKNDEEANTTTSVKSWTHIELTKEWKRYSFTPADLIDAENDNGGNVGWDAVKDNVTNISIFGGSGGEFWIDDIEVFGLEKFTLKE